MYCSPYAPVGTLPGRLEAAASISAIVWSVGIAAGRQVCADSIGVSPVSRSAVVSRPGGEKGRIGTVLPTVVRIA
jgi:hypothetical protein